MKTNIVRIGNSKGIRLSKTILEQCQLRDEVELEVEGDRLVIRPVSEPRKGWDRAFAQMAENRDDVLLDHDTDTTTEWDRTEWRW